MNELETLKFILKETLWMARRYADGRSTYAPRMFNDAVHLLDSIGHGDLLPADCGKRFASDGMFGEYDSEKREFIRGER